ncbi:MAG: hypothetical protein A3H96_20465 [Acidobacteria bacterium RIFCSPLOWO2_02_FULL_67_36]|nr:MAG: hypothetical protein A3H96_20465 [Acidobacteria bacterium RIFCSPLOWO2_02_FULL_67_36]OFW18624.1 MAG: hypothetical protein A3G21_12870 [Acidobacteria bacterium RIFCSPLOWO2_12_FULL_66_21]
MPAAGVLAVAGLGVAALRTTIVGRVAADGAYELVVVGASLRDMALTAAATIAVAALASVLLARRAADRGLPVSLAPLLVFALPIGGVAAAMWGRSLAPALVHWLWELAPWWLAIGCAVTAGRALSPAPAAQPFRVRSAAWPFLLAAALVCWILATNTNLRGWAEPHGDEPQYLRHDELWYQGKGEDISQVSVVTDLPRGMAPRVPHSAALGVRALVHDVWSLVWDVKASLTEPGFVWLRAQGSGGGFITREGRTYQSHQPGLSLLILPGYTVDRWLLSSGTVYRGQFPDRLLTVQATLVAMAALGAIAIGALCRRAGAGAALAALLAFLGCAALPASSMALQAYPETAAGLAIAAALALSTRDRGSTRSALVGGLLAGYPLLLHVRFLAVVVVLLGFGAWALRRSRRLTLLFALGWFVPVLAQTWYAYHASGLPWPSAFYNASDGGTWIDPAAIPLNFLRYAADRNWGALPHAPLLLLALPGLLPLWRARRDLAVAVVLLAGVLTATSAAHAVSAAGGTPGRFITAVLPLLVIPIAAAVREWHARPVFRLLFLGLSVLTLDQAWNYNRSHVKELGMMVAEGASGWRVNLLFPDLAEGITSQAALTLLVMAALVTLLAATLWRRSRVSEGPAHARDGVAAVSLTACLVLLTTTAGAWDLSHPRYRVRDGNIRTRLVSAYVRAETCALCWSSRRGPLGGADLASNTVSDIGVRAETGRSRRVRFALTAIGPEGPSFGAARFDFGDGEVSAPRVFAGEIRVAHRYGRAGEYDVKAWFDRPGAPRLMAASLVRVDDDGR